MIDLINIVGVIDLLSGDDGVLENDRVGRNKNKLIN